MRLLIAAPVTSGHALLGLASVSDGRAARILTVHAITVDSLRAAYLS
jgi:hypothetical protein